MKIKKHKIYFNNGSAKVLNDVRKVVEHNLVYEYFYFDAKTQQIEIMVFTKKDIFKIVKK